MTDYAYVLLFDEYIKKEDLHKTIIENDFKTYKSPWHENSYLWKGEEYVSIRGCHAFFRYDAYIQGPDKKFKTVFSAIVTRGGSYTDVKKQFDILKTIQSLYGGQIFDERNNSSGLRENEIPYKRSKTEIACGITYVHFKSRVSNKAANHIIEDVNLNHIRYDYSIDLYDYPDSLVKNNQIINELITTLEVFLKSFFEKYLKTNESLYKKFIMDCTSKKQLNDDEKFKEHMKTYRFQNLKDVNKVYKKYIDFNLKEEVLNIEMVSGREDTKIGYILGRLLQNRNGKSHDDIHDTELIKSKVIEYRTVITTFGDKFIEKIMERKKLKLLIEYDLGY